MIKAPSVWELMNAGQSKPKLGGVWDAIGQPTDAAGRPLPPGSMGHRPEIEMVGNQVPLPGTGQQITLPPVDAAPPMQMGEMGAAVQNFGPTEPIAAPVNMPIEAAAIPDAQKNGIFDRIGAFMASDEGKGALLRSGAATIQGGIGAGIAAGADWTDKRRMQNMQSDQFDQKHALDVQGTQIDQQREDRQGLYQAGRLEIAAANLGIDVRKLEHTIRKDEANIALDAQEMQMLQAYRAEQVRLKYLEEQGRNKRTAATIGSQERRHNTPSGSTLATQAGARERAMLPPAAYDTTSTVSENDDGVKTTVSSRNPLPRVTTAAQYNALASGTPYTDSLGQRAVKP